MKNVAREMYLKKSKVVGLVVKGHSEIIGYSVPRHGEFAQSLQNPDRNFSLRSLTELACGDQSIYWQRERTAKYVPWLESRALVLFP